VYYTGANEGKDTIKRSKFEPRLEVFSERKDVDRK
jgi:hypothetical protein